MQHGDLWAALDALAASRGLTPSGLARAAGLDPTTFNKSKRVAADGKPRWPSTESLALALEACGASFDDFAGLLAGRAAGAGRAIPIVGMTQAAADGFFDASGFPAGAEETVRFPDLGPGPVYALEVAGDSMEPAWREGDVVIVQPGASVRRGDRVAVRRREGGVLLGVLGRRNDQTIELLPLNPMHSPNILPSEDLDWISRVVWASQ